MNSLIKKNFIKNLTAATLIFALVLTFVFSGCSIISAVLKKPETSGSVVTQNTGAGTTSIQTTTVASETTSAQTSGTTGQAQETTASDNSKEIEADFNNLVAGAGDDTIKIFQFIDANIKNANPDTATLMVAKVIKDK